MKRSFKNIEKQIVNNRNILWQGQVFYFLS